MHRKNKVTLISYMGSDELHALAAWSSTFLDAGVDLPKDHQERLGTLILAIQCKQKKTKSIPQLLKFLADHGHTSPFRSSAFLFTMESDLRTHIQKLKHRVILEQENAESARYKELKDKYYLPLDWLEYGRIGKYWYEVLNETTEDNNRLYHKCIKDLTAAGMPRQRAKETAAYFKMTNTSLSTTNKFSFDGLVQFHQKRATSEAQREIADIAEQMINEVRSIEGNPFKYSLEAFGL
jgi:thymidylate synthase ThyX